VCGAAGPITGIGTNYAIMAGINSLCASRNGASKKEIVTTGLRAPWNTYKKMSNEIAQITIGNGNYKACSFSEIFLITFNLLKSSKMFGELVYGLKPFSSANGDGQILRRDLGLKKDYTVSPWTGLGLAMTPALGANAFGLAKGIYLRLNKKSLQDIKKIPPKL